MRNFLFFSSFILFFIACGKSDDKDEHDFCSLADQSSVNIEFSNITTESIFISEDIRSYIVRADVTNISDNIVTGDCFIVVEINGDQSIFGTPFLHCSNIPANSTCEFVAQSNATENSILDTDIPILCYYYIESE